MRLTRDGIRLCSVVIASVLAFVPVHAQDRAAVKVWQENLADGRVTYHYRVFNLHPSRHLHGFKIGYDYLKDTPELIIPPIGWSIDTAEVREDEFGFKPPTDSMTAPVGWYSVVLPTEEANELQLSWYSDDGVPGLPPGARKRGFSVTVAEADTQYVQGHWTAFFSGGFTRAGRIAPDDNPAQPDPDSPPPPPPPPPLPPADVTPPSLLVVPNPNALWPANRKMVAVEMHVATTDDTDRAPKVSLVSITANETIDPSDVAGAQVGADDRTFSLRAARNGRSKQGRVYTITYASTDSAGNRAETSVFVIVPHDQRNRP